MICGRLDSCLLKNLRLTYYLQSVSLAVLIPFSDSLTETIPEEWVITTPWLYDSINFPE